nr:M56 family metallopeptidase [uncultured Bacteroides sp.]
MGTLFVYILKSSVCLAAFYLFYRLLLSRETFHRFNRFALLGILLLSSLLPLVEISVERQTEIHHTMMTLEQWLLLANAAEMGTVQVPTQDITWIQVALALYLLGILFFAFRNVYSLCRLLLLLKSGRKEVAGKYINSKDKVTLIVHERDIAPFSWMKYIVISRKDLDENGREILIHELAHIHNRHSWDLLVADVCIFFQWFNPASWLLKQELQNIHEYEADETVIKEGVDAKQYQLLLIKKAVGTRLYSMANSFNHSKLKKRITMMLKEKSSPWARLKYLYVLPLAAVAVTAFARPEVSEKAEEISRTSAVLEREQVNSLFSRVQDVSTDKVNDLAAIVETKIVESKDVPAEVSKTMDTPQDTVKTAVTPLFIVDGNKVSSEIMKALRPESILSITVLKDKEAVKVYGEEGKNGVMLITLKKDSPMQMLGEGNPDNGGQKVTAFTPKKNNSGLRGIVVNTSEDDLSNLEVYVDGIKVDMKGKDLNSVVVPADKIESVSINKTGDNKGAVYIVTKKTKPLEGTAAKGEFKVEGKVIDTKGEPVIGASILIEGTNRGTVTDLDGNFVMPASKNDVLVACYIGMQTTKVEAAPKVTITMKSE